MDILSVKGRGEVVGMIDARGLPWVLAIAASGCGDHDDRPPPANTVARYTEVSCMPDAGAVCRAKVDYFECAGDVPDEDLLEEVCERLEE